MRNQTPENQADFVLSLLKGAAVEEVRLRKEGQSLRTEDIFSYLREAFREKRSPAQLLQTFYTRKQLEEDLRAYSHALSQILNSVFKQSPDAIVNMNIALRDQFIEGVRDAALRRELRKLMRDKPQSTLIEVRDEALLWSFEDPTFRASKVALNRNVNTKATEAQCAAMVMPATSSVMLDEVLKVVAEQGKAIGELTQAVQKFTLHCTQPESVNQISDRDRLLKHAVGKCPVVDLKIGGVDVSCLLDTGSQVSTITEHFFKEHLAGEEKDMLYTTGWLKITAANGLDIPYLGYLELTVETMGITLPECGFFSSPGHTKLFC